MAYTSTERRKRLKRSVRKKIHGTPKRPRLSIFRSNRGIYAQLIDDTKGLTLASSSSVEVGDALRLNVEASRSVGKKLAEKAAGVGVTAVVFDRNGYLYHGNVKALAEGVREGGLKL